MPGSISGEVAYVMFWIRTILQTDCSRVSREKLVSEKSGTATADCRLEIGLKTKGIHSFELRGWLMDL